MPEFNLVKNPVHSPTRCFICHDHAGPMIDTFIEDPTTNTHVYICAPNEKRPGCVAQMAYKIGLVPKSESEALEEKVEALEFELSQLRSKTYTISVNDLESANTPTVKTGFSLRSFSPTH